jgi:hypothetical protein
MRQRRSDAAGRRTPRELPIRATFSFTVAIYTL